MNILVIDAQGGGIIIQLITIPALVLGLNKAKLIKL